MSFFRRGDGPKSPENNDVKETNKLSESSEATKKLTLEREAFRNNLKVKVPDRSSADVSKAKLDKPKKPTESDGAPSPPERDRSNERTL